MAVYIHKKETALFILRNSSTIIVDGKTVDQGPIILHFENFKCDTSRMKNGKEAEELMDDCIRRNPRGLISKMPSKARVEKITKAVEKLKKVKDKAVAEAVEKDASLKDALKEKKEFDDFVKKVRESEPQLVQGMRDIHK